MFSTVLIANRGEIALRIARTCEWLGIEPVMIYTAADADAPHTRFVPHHLGITAEVPSYLDIEAVVAAAIESKAEAIHPGYGFLSERAAFAAAVEAAGLVLVGPSAAVMEQLGRKDAAREVALAAGVPVVPSFAVDGFDTLAALAAQPPQEPALAAQPPEFPVLVKAAAGGGGKGMRIVRTPEEFEPALAAARREAQAAFGDDAMLIEKYVEHGRHIEVQILADAHGTVLHLFERDCSSQRRHQKVIEEAPAPTIDEALREQLTSAAVALATRAGYVNAGTVEFLLDTATNAFYFLEMNTRLQVEHPVTELIVSTGSTTNSTGSTTNAFDLVEQQLRIAAGEPFAFAQDDLRINGHAMEARIYAEDAYAGFLPQAGTATVVRWPTNARVDHALESGQVVSTAFDPMLGKVVVHGADREAARQALIEALDDTAIFGLTTNVGFLRELAASEAFAEARVDTAWLDRNELPEPDDETARMLAGVMLLAELESSPAGPWQPDGFRSSGPRGPLVEEGRDLSIRGALSPDPAGEVDGVARVGLYPSHGFVFRATAGTEVVHHGQRFVFGRSADRVGQTSSVDEGIIVAPMPGTVLEVAVSVGQQVAVGDPLGTMEAMKMELSLKATVDGMVSEVDVAVGDLVSLGDRLFVVDPQ